MGVVAYKDLNLASASRGRIHSFSSAALNNSAALKPDLRLHLAINNKVIAEVPFWKRDLLFSFIVIASLALFFCGLAFFASIRHSVLPQIFSEYDYGDYVNSPYAPSDKDSFLLRLNSLEQRKLNAHVHYVSNVIRDTRASVKNVKQIAYAIVLESRKADLDPLFVTAVIKSESTFNHTALSYAGALGLMQLMPATAKYVSDKHEIDWQGIAKLKDPYYNIKLGVAYLKYLEKLFDGNRQKMLIAYNWGPTNLNNALKNRNKAPSSTIQYARTIISDHAKWRADFAARLPEFSYAGMGA